MSATIYDVASRAGVSIATVSRSLNAPQAVHSATRQRVLAAIDELGFVPKAEATARARRRHRQIGVVAPFFTYWAFVQRLRGVAAGLLDAGFELVVFNAETADHVRDYFVSLPVSRRFDGLVVISLCVDQLSAERMLAQQLPIVLIEATDARFSGVAVDNVLGGQLAAQHLLDRGHRRIGFVGGDRELASFTLRTSLLRLQGFAATLSVAGIEPLVADLPHDSASGEDGRRQALQLLDRPVRPTAIFAASDTLALGVLSAARERNLRVPHDLAVLGFDDLEFAVHIGLSTVSQSLEESGRLAVELLLAGMAESERAVRQIHLPLKVLHRDTT